MTQFIDARVPALRLIAAGWLVGVIAAMSGCGYSGRTHFPTEYRTVAVAIFDNRTFYRGVEFDLTEALTKQIEAQTPYKIASLASADTVIEGTIIEVNQIRLSRREDGGLPQEMEVQITVDVTWKDQRTGSIIRDRRGLTAAGRYAPAREIGETFAVAQHDTARRLAGMVVSAMTADW